MLLLFLSRYSVFYRLIPLSRYAAAVCNSPVRGAHPVGLAHPNQSSGPLFQVPRFTCRVAEAFARPERDVNIGSNSSFLHVMQWRPYLYDLLELKYSRCIRYSS